MKAGRALLLLVVVGAAGYFLWRWQSREEGRGSGEISEASDIVVLREKGAAYFEEGGADLPKARELLTEVAEHADATAQDLVNLACVDLGDAAKARALLDRAEALDPDLAAIHYVRGILAVRDVDFEAARGFFQRAVELAPDDAPSRLQLGTVLAELGDLEGASREYQFLYDLGPEFAGGYYPIAIYRLARLDLRSQDPEVKKRGQELLELHRSLGIEPPAEDAIEKGTLARVKVPLPVPFPGTEAPPDTALSFTPAGAPVGTAAGAVQFAAAADLNADGVRDLLILGDPGSFLALAAPEGPAVEHPLPQGRWEKAVAGDLIHEPALPAGQEPPAGSGPAPLAAHVLLLAADGARLFAPGSGFTFRENPLPRALRAADAVFVDHDHEGDLDLLAATDQGLVLLRNDGAVPPAEGELPLPAGVAPLVNLSDVTAEAKLPSSACSWVTVEDLDADADIDFLAGTEDGAPFVVSNLRKGRFEVIGAEHCGLGAVRGRLLLADLDHDGFVDVVAGAGLFLNQGDGTFERAGDLREPWGPAVLADMDLNGEPDFCTAAADRGVHVALGSLLRGGASPVAVPGRAAGTSAPVVADLDADGVPDVLAAAERGVQVLRGVCASPPAALRVLLAGNKDNPGGVGSVVEVRSAALYQRKLAHEGIVEFGLGSVGKADVVRVTWPNGIVQHSVDVAAPGTLRVLQKEGLVGSCPFLYTFNGEKYEFITDVLGVTPLGLPMREGAYVPPDHDELVRIEGRQLALEKGVFRMAVTEELREVTYLDRAQLWVVEHDEDVEVHPEERFTFPPFPPQRLHALRDVRGLEAARDGEGRDWSRELAAVDGMHAVPFRPAPSQYLGLATPHTLELTLPEAARTAKQVRLLMTGWFFWTDASVNVAVGHDAGWEFVPPLLQVPDGAGGWRDTGPPVGFPAGKTKTMVLDVTDLLNREDPRLRVFSSIRLYWDAIRVALDQEDAPLEIIELEPAVAELSWRGFSRPEKGEREDQPERFEFHALLDEAPWNQHQGMLTRYGDVTPLLTAMDDRFVIFSAGDSIDLRFVARWLPDPEPGRARTYFLFLDGWAKDADPNTEFAGTVEPLPFHGMSGYPYGPDEHYPDDEVHRQYLEEWNTRPGRRLVPRLDLLGAAPAAGRGPPRSLAEPLPAAEEE